MRLTAPAAAVAAAYRQADALGHAPAAESLPSFGAVLARAVEEAVAIGHSTDAAATAALLGQGSVTEVVLAVSRAEVTLQTAVALRDRLIAAYQEVMRMPI